MKSILIGSEQNKKYSIDYNCENIIELLIYMYSNYSKKLRISTIESNN